MPDGGNNSSCCCCCCCTWQLLFASRCLFSGLFFFLGREKDQNREAHAESNRVEEEGGFKEERRLKGKGEEKEEEEEVIALGSVCSSSIPQLLSSALCALALSLVPPPIRDSPLFPRLQKGAPSLFCETRALLSKRGGGSKGGAELHLQERTLEKKRVEFVRRRSSSCKNSRATNPSSLRPLHFYPQFPFPFAGREARGQSGSSKGGAGVSGRFVQKRSPPPFFPACSCVVGSVYKARHSSFFLSFEHLFL